MKLILRDKLPLPRGSWKVVIVSINGCVRRMWLKV